MYARAILCAAVLAASGASSAPAADAPVRLSVASDGTGGDGPSYLARPSRSGRFVVFSSDATNLVPGDTNGVTDVFHRDRSTGVIRRVSVSDVGVQGNSRSFAGGVTRDGRLVVFWSYSSNLVPGDTNGREDIFVHDVHLGITRRVNLAPDGAEADNVSRYPVISDNGRWIAYHSNASNLVSGDANGEADIFLYDVRRDTTARIGQPENGESDGSSLYPTMDARGRFVAWESSATNLVPGDENGVIDAFVYDRRTETLLRASVSTAGEEGNGQSRGPILSANGRHVVFSSRADALAPGDGDDEFDVFVHHLRSGETELVSVGAGGAPADGSSGAASVDRRGRLVLFTSSAENLVEGDANEHEDAFIRDLRRATTFRLDATIDGREPDGDTWGGALSGNGRHAFVETAAGNLVAGDENESEDVILYSPWR